MTKDQLIAELRKQGYGRIADMLETEPLKVVDPLDEYRDELMARSMMLQALSDDAITFAKAAAYRELMQPPKRKAK